jgi:hypothetical protein
MDSLTGYLLRIGIVRVLSVPVAMVVLISLLWIMARPPQDDNDEDATPRA